MKFIRLQWRPLTVFIEDGHRFTAVFTGVHKNGLVEMILGADIPLLIGCPRADVTLHVALHYSTTKKKKTKTQYSNQQNSSINQSLHPQSLFGMNDQLLMSKKKPASWKLASSQRRSWSVIITSFYFFLGFISLVHADVDIHNFMPIVERDRPVVMEQKTVQIRWLRPGTYAGSFTRNF